jgi:spore germination protein KA
MLVSGIWGIFGFIALLFVILAHLCSLRSFGVPFLAPFAPLIPADLKDTQIRSPAWAMSKRPKFLGSIDSVRQKSNLKPGIKQNNGKPSRREETDE